MKCISWKEGYYLLFNTTNCVEKKRYIEYYINLTDLVPHPCSLFKNANCYEGDPYLINNGICLSCAPGYKYNNITN